ncbi:MAG: CHASE2 domain-containing protein [Opitutales bacterium]
MAKPKLKFDWRLVLLLPIPLLWCWAAQLGYLRFLDDLLLDYRFRFRGQIEAPVPVVYVDIDSESVSDLGNFPWPRSYFAQVGSALTETGRAKAVGVDVVFSEKGVSPSYDMTKWVRANAEFQHYLLGNPPMVIAASYSAREYRDIDNKLKRRELPMLRYGLPPIAQVPEPELPEFRIGRSIIWNPGRVGLIDTLDGGTRWVPLFAPCIHRYDHMALALALLYWGVEPDKIRISDKVIEIPGKDGALLGRIPLTDKQTVEVNWFSSWDSDRNPRIGFSTAYQYAQMLRGTDAKGKAAALEFFKQFEGAVVLIGPVDPLLQDLAVTPFDETPVPRVGIHGNLLKTIVSGSYLHRISIPGLYVLTLVLTVLITFLSVTGGARGIRYKLTALLLLTGYVVLAFYVFKAGNWVLPMAAPLGGACMTAFGGVIWQLVIEEKQKGRIKGMFSAYLAPTVVNSLIDSGKEPELGGHEENITAYFSDIQSFSTFSEKMTPARLVELMNEYLTACTDLVQEEGGTLDKYIGDAVVAIYGAPLVLPDHAYRASVACIRVQQKLVELRAKWKSEGEKWPPVVHNLRARLGLNSGPAIIGNMGSRTRFSYTMMGDNVNLAARMESGAKLLGVYTMVTDSTRAECEKHGGDRIVFRFLDRIVVKGRSLPVGVHEIVGLRAELAAPVQECLGVHAQAIERYLAQDWDEAMRLFQQSARLEANQPNKALGLESNPSLVMLDRCQYWKEHPPGPGWNGAFTMKDKG